MNSVVIPRHPKKIITDDTVAIRKVRELRKYTRNQAAILMGVSNKLIEAIENGRVQLLQDRIDEFCAAYHVSRVQYDRIKVGEIISLVEKKPEPPRPNIIENKSLRRNYKKIVDRRVRAIVSLRHEAKICQREASSRCGYARCQFGQVETGRIEMSEKRILHIVASLGFSLEDYKRELLGEKTTHEMRSECFELLKDMSSAQLSTFLPLIRSMAASVTTSRSKG